MVKNVNDKSVLNCKSKIAFNHFYMKSVCLSPRRTFGLFLLVVNYLSFLYEYK